MGQQQKDIFLPQTSFAMRGNLSTLEPALLEKWARENLYEKLRQKREGCSRFILHWGPPYANGSIHLGHALNALLKDVINRSKSLQGYDAPLVPGWDCHGLPIEWKVEEAFRKKGKKKGDVPVRAFRQACRDFAEKWIPLQKQEFQRLGVLADWDAPYITMETGTEALILKELHTFLERGLIYRGVRPVMWSVVEQTALAEAEVEYENKTSPSIYVLFPCRDIPTPLTFDLPKDSRPSVMIWTTTPWSLPGNRAIAYDPDTTYALVHGPSLGHVILAQDLVETVLKKTMDVTSYKVIQTFAGRDLHGMTCDHPLKAHGYDFAVPLLPGDHVSLDAGTGLVHTAPCHGPEDFEMAKQFDLEVPEPIGEDGVFHDHVPLVAGQHVFKVDPMIIDALKAHQTLAHATTLEHSYPHSWRSKAPLIYRATAQWFAAMDKEGLRTRALDAIQKVRWIPEQGKNRIHAMVAGRPDWCLSRQRSWGVPLAFFVHKKTAEPLVDAGVFQRIRDYITQEGCDAWFERPARDFLGEAYDEKDYEKVRDILDVWFDSGATQGYVLEAFKGLQRPADLYLEGSDQHRGWFQSSLLLGCATRGDAPYKTVLTHGFCLDAQGRKFSKSLGNGQAPQDVIQSSGAEILRLWTISSDFTEDVRIGPEILKHQQDLYRRFRNTLRYLLGTLSDPHTPDTWEEETLGDLEAYMLHRLAEIHRLHEHALETYDLQGFYLALHGFCAVDLSAFYFDIRKDTLYCDPRQETKRLGTLYVMNQIFHHLVHWLAPVLCFTAEEAWLARHGEKVESIHLSLFPKPKEAWFNEKLGEKMDILRRHRRIMTQALEEARHSGLIGSSLQAQLHLHDPKGVLDPSYSYEEMAIVSKVILSRDADTHWADEGDTLFAVTVSLAPGEKCQRCWRVTEDTKDGQCARCQGVTA